MKKIKCLAMAICFLAVAPVWAQDEETGDLIGFLQGTYRLVGQWPDSGETYQGVVVMKSQGDRLAIERTINGRVVQAAGRITKATADGIKVLTVTFSRRNLKYQATYLIQADLDNYARLTGYLYQASGKTVKPGLEAMFIDR